MNALRRAHHLSRFVLLWFVLSLGVAIAAPVIHPQAMELVCSSAGAIKVIVKSDDGARELGGGHTDCPLCAIVGAPPPALPVVAPVAPALPLGRVVQSIPAARLAAATAAPLPARGPPAA